MTCLNCANWQLQSSKGMARSGFASCKHREPHRFMSENQTCHLESPLAPALVAKRIAWLNPEAMQPKSSESPASTTN